MQLQPKAMLLLLDNFEQVTAAAPKMGELLQGCPQLKLLVTSREALHLRGEHIHPVPPLALPGADLKQQSLEQLTQCEAVAIVHRTRSAVKPDFEVTNENAPAVAEICFRLDGLPLAIELAAARIRLFSPRALLERVGGRLKLLRGGARDLPLRQQTLRDTMDWSYELLGDDEQRLFALLSVFAGCTFEAVEAVARGINHLSMGRILDVLDGLASLVDKSLIRQQIQDTGEPRFLMLETIREYATERLEQDRSSAPRLTRPMPIYFADFAAASMGTPEGDGREAALREMESDIENLRIAWRYWVEKKDLEQLNKFVNSLWLLYDARGWYHATVGTHERFTERPGCHALHAGTRRTGDHVANQPGSRADGNQRIYRRSRAGIRHARWNSAKSAGEIPQLFPGPARTGLSSITFVMNHEKASRWVSACWIWPSASTM